MTNSNPSHDPFLTMPDGSRFPVSLTLKVEDLYLLRDSIFELPEEKQDAYVEEDGRLRLIGTQLTAHEIEHISASLWRNNLVCDEYVDEQGHFVFRLCIRRSSRSKKKARTEVTW